MCSVARNFSRFSNCRFMLIPVRCTTSSAEQATSEATVGTNVATLGGAHAVTLAEDIAGSSAAALPAIGEAVEASDEPEVICALEFDKFCKPCFAMAALAAFGKSRKTASNSC